MKQNIEILLGEWGYWKAGGDVTGLGLPSSSAFTDVRVDSKRRVEPYAFMVDDDMRRVDSLISRLHPDFAGVVTAHYVWSGLVKNKFDRLKISRTDYYARLDFAHRQLSHEMGGRYVIKEEVGQSA